MLSRWGGFETRFEESESDPPLDGVVGADPGLILRGLPRPLFFGRDTSCIGGVLVGLVSLITSSSLSTSLLELLPELLALLSLVSSGFSSFTLPADGPLVAGCAA